MCQPLSVWRWSSTESQWQLHTSYALHTMNAGQHTNCSNCPNRQSSPRLALMLLIKARRGGGMCRPAPHWARSWVLVPCADVHWGSGVGEGKVASLLSFLLPAGVVKVCEWCAGCVAVSGVLIVTCHVHLTHAKQTGAKQVKATLIITENYAPPDNKSLSLPLSEVQGTPWSIPSVWLH